LVIFLSFMTAFKGGMFYANLAVKSCFLITFY